MTSPVGPLAICLTCHHESHSSKQAVTYNAADVESLSSREALRRGNRDGHVLGLSRSEYQPLVGFAEIDFPSFWNRMVVGTVLGQDPSSTHLGFFLLCCSRRARRQLQKLIAV